MSSRKALVIIVAGLVLALAFGIFGTRKQIQTPQEIKVFPKEFVVALTDAGFSPGSVTISTGGAVRFVNQSSKEKASVNSDDYPTNKKYPELNLGAFQKGSGLVHIFARAGIYTYHDQFHPEHKGTIVVQ